MSNKLDVARRIINEVDSQMAELFVKRMRAAETVYEYKKELGLPILDQKREDAVIERNTALIEDEALKGLDLPIIAERNRIVSFIRYIQQFPAAPGMTERKCSLHCNTQFYGCGLIYDRKVAVSAQARKYCIFRQSKQKRVNGIDFKKLFHKIIYNYLKKSAKNICYKPETILYYLTR